MHAARVIGRELRFWGQSLLVCCLPLGFIWMFAGHLGFPNPFQKVDPGTSHATTGHAQIGFLVMVAVFYSMRSTDRVAYGLAELLLSVIGFSIFYDRLGDAYSPDAFLLTVGGLIYLAVRGLDNIVTGAKRHYADPSTDPRWF